MSHDLKIGRAVHYQHVEGCRTSAVVWVWGDTVVNLHVSSSQTAEDKEDRLSYGRTSVVHGMDQGQWHWPDECPYNL